MLEVKSNYLCAEWLSSQHCPFLVSLGRCHAISLSAQQQIDEICRSREIKAYVQDVIPHVLAIGSLIFMFVNFVILFTITSIQIHEELMLANFQLMYFS